MTDTQQGDADPDAGAAARPGDDSDQNGPWDRFERWREGVRSRPAAARIYRICVGTLGSAIILGGLALVPLPGPGWLIVFLGLAILASEFEWAHRVEQYTRQKVAAWTHWLGRQHLAVRVLAGLATFLFVLGICYALLRLSGVPGWVPDGVVDAVPGLTK